MPSQVCSAGWKYIFFSLQLSMNWNESVILFIGFWIDYYQNNSASIWEKVGLHRVHTLQFLSEHFFFLITAGILRSSVAGRKLKIEDSTWQVCGGVCAFLTCFLGDRPPYKWKKKYSYNTRSYDRIHTNSSASEAADWQPLHHLLTNSLLTNCLPGTLCTFVPCVNSLSRLHVKLNRYPFDMRLWPQSLFNALLKA